MKNVPTDLLRTLVTVVDEQGFTRASQVLGVTQPAVSAQIKRLQTVLGNDLFERTGHGPNLTAKGARMLEYARRILALNDTMLQAAEASSNASVIRMGMPEDYVGAQFTSLLGGFHSQWPDLRFSILPGTLERQLHELRQGQIDIVLGPSIDGCEADARHRWSEEAVWLRGRGTALDPNAPVPLVAFREDWICHRVAVNALSRAGRASELVFTAPTITSLAAAVGAGIGVMALSRCRVRLPDMVIWEDAPLPKLPNLNWGIYVRDGDDCERLEEIADATATLVIARVASAAKREMGPPVKTIVPRKREAS